MVETLLVDQVLGLRHAARYQMGKPVASGQWSVASLRGLGLLVTNDLTTETCRHCLQDPTRGWGWALLRLAALVWTAEAAVPTLSDFPLLFFGRASSVTFVIGGGAYGLLGVGVAPRIEGAVLCPELTHA